MDKIDAPPFPFAPGPLSSVPPEYAKHRATCPFGRVRLRSGHDAVLLVSHADAVAALGDTRLSHDLTAPHSPRLAAGLSYRDDPEIILNLEGQKHRRIRRLMAAAFTPQNIRRFRPVIRTITSELIDRMEQAEPPADLVGAYCATLPVRVIGALLGLPEDDMSRFQEWSDAFALAAPMSAAQRAERLAEFGNYIADLIAAKRAEPGDSLIDDLVSARDGADTLTESELPYLVMALIVGGTHTTSNTLGRSMLTLLRDNGARWHQLVTQPTLIPRAVDELLRVNGLGDLLQLRVATEDVGLPSGTVEKGQAVVVAVQAALQDSAVYQDPEEVRFDRDIIAPLYFGGGPHFCIGAHLAKAELEIALELLAERLPGLRLAADLDELRFTEGEELSSLVSLPVSWDAAESDHTETGGQEHAGTRAQEKT